MHMYMYVCMLRHAYVCLCTTIMYAYAYLRVLVHDYISLCRLMYAYT